MGFAACWRYSLYSILLVSELVSEHQKLSRNFTIFGVKVSLTRSPLPLNCFHHYAGHKKHIQKWPCIPYEQLHQEEKHWLIWVFHPFHWVLHAPKGAKRIKKERLQETIRDSKVAVVTSISSTFEVQKWPREYKWCALWACHFIFFCSGKLNMHWNWYMSMLQEFPTVQLWG